MRPVWYDYDHAQRMAYAQGQIDTRRELLIPEWSCFTDVYMPWKVGILCHVFGVWTQFYIVRTQGEQMDVGAWQAIQERLVVEAAVYQIRLLMGLG
jgi:hypothetical protein